MTLNNPILLEYPAPGIAKITLNRPKSLNALNKQLLYDLVEALRITQSSHRIIILEGAGERSFCAGEDLKETLAPDTGSAEELRQAFGKLQDLTRLTSSSPAIVIAAVHGFAIGGGAEIALAADFVIGGPKATFKFPEASIGHAVTGGISLRLTQMVGLLKAKELLIRGQFVKAEEAQRLGLLTELVDDPKARALELALELSTLPAVSVAHSKTSLERAVFPNMEMTLQDEVNVASYCFAQSDAAEAFSKFAARRNPVERDLSTGSLVSPGSVVVGRNDSLRANEGIPVKEPAEIKKGNGTSGKLASSNLAIYQELHKMENLNAALKRAREKFSSQIFIRMDGRDTTFEQFDTSVARLAGGLRDLGIGIGDRVVVMMRNSLEMIETWFAVNRLGATWVPVNVELKSITLVHVLEAAAGKLALADLEFEAELRNSGQWDPKSILVRDSSNSYDFHNLYSLGTPVENAVVVSPSTTSAFLYTSGTTGRSKPCILSHQYFIIQALTLIESFKLVSSDVLYCPFPLFHADATALTTIPALLLGATAAISRRFSASKFWDEIISTKATVYDFMGATLAIIYKNPPSSKDTAHSIRLAWGVPIPAFAEEYERRFNHPLYTLYGSVEASLPIMQDLGRPLPVGSCGVVRPGYTARIASDDDQPLPPNTIGNLLLRSDQANSFFRGYFNADLQTVAAFQNLWFHTGDLARIDEHGNVFFCGRTKDIIRRRGENINAGELEEEFLRHPDVMMVAAYAIPAALGNGSGTEDDVKVAIVRREGSDLDEKKAWEWAVANMAKFQVPSVVEIVNEIKKTPTGKIEKRNLPIDGGVRFDIRT